MQTRFYRLWQYFAFEGVNAFSAILFLYAIFFWTKERYHFTNTENLFLMATHGLIYIFAALFGGRLGDRMGYHRLLRLCLAGMSLTLLFGWIPNWHWTPFVVVAIYTVFIGPTWPTLEAAILHAPGRTKMPDRLGIYNIVWAFGDGAGLFIGGALFGWNSNAVLFVPGIIHLGQFLWISFASSSETAGQSAMEMPHRGDEIPTVIKKQFMHLAWLANGLGFLMFVSFSALSPSIGTHLKLPVQYAIWLSCTPLFSRGVAFVLFWKWEQWHYQKMWSHLALWLGPLCLTISFFVPNILSVFIALFFFGMATGLAYSGSLYYSLDYGENKGEHGGLHEAILGGGMLVGPLLGAIVSGLGGGTDGAKTAIIILTLSANVIGLWVIQLRNREQKS